jgi:acetylornithine deacetylase/succinyl-diaminopimelate desuccinylase-like protein
MVGQDALYAVTFNLFVMNRKLLNEIRSTESPEDDRFIVDLQSLIKQKSISATKQGLVECANLVLNIMQNAGITSELLYLDRNEDVPPIVYGEVKSKANPNGKTILFYNHYDVQPIEPVELWNQDPFSGKVEGDYIFGRGSADDKGELITRIKTVEYFLKKIGDVPCNVKFIVEGEEETGSMHIEKYLSVYREKFLCTGVIWESGDVDEKDRPIISLGMKGILSVELIAKEASKDVHSSLAVLIENPAWRLIRAIESMRDDKGNILIRDWYKEARVFTKEEVAALASEPFDEHEFKREYGIDKFLNNLKATEARKVLAGTPTCNIVGFISGYTGEGIKNILPAIAIAKLDFRLIPDMMPQLQFERLQNHLQKNGFEDICLKFVDGEPASRTSISHPLVHIVIEAATEAFGTSITSVSAAGTGPMYYFNKVLNVPCISVGSTYIYANIHSPNEFARIDLLRKTIKCMSKIMEKVAATPDF